jgi:hypothetical protein
MTRLAELDAHRGFWQDLTMYGNIPEHVSTYLKDDEVIATISAGWGLDYSEVIRTQQEQQAEEARRAQMEQGAQQPPMPEGQGM